MPETFTTLKTYVMAGGVLLLPLTLVCFAIWAYLLRMRSALHRALAGRRDADGTPPAVSRQALAYVTAAVAAGARPDDAFDTFTSLQLTTLRRDIGILAAFTASAPLLGLLGTVIGMVKTFDAVAGATAIHEADLALGIQRALITTQLGLVIALPGVFGAARLRRLIDHVRIALATGRSQFLLHHAGPTEDPT